jgi:hypothetical protein
VNPLALGKDLSHERDDSAKTGKAQEGSENPPQCFHRASPLAYHIRL